MSEKLERDQPDLPSTDGDIAVSADPSIPDKPPILEAAEAEPDSLVDSPNPLYPVTPAVTPAADASLDELEAATTETGPVAEGPADTESAGAVKSFWREVLETVLLTIMIFFLVKGLVANFRIVGTSMEPNFHTNQNVLVNKAAYFHSDINTWVRLIPGVHPEGQNVVWMFGGPKRGDVVIFEPPDALDEDYIKRVIGLPGDKVEIRGGKVLVNDKELNEPYIREAPFSPYNPTVVPPNSLFVMGDNRNASRDSRSFGMLPIDKIVGKALVVYWPFGDKWGPVPEVSYK